MRPRLSNSVIASNLSMLEPTMRHLRRGPRLGHQLWPAFKRPHWITLYLNGV